MVGRGIASGVEENKTHDMEMWESQVPFRREVWRSWLVNSSSEEPDPTKSRSRVQTKKETES